MSTPNLPRRLLPWRLWPRGRLDIGWQDLLFAARVGCFPGAALRHVWPTKTPHLPMLSVRTAWDALLTIQDWPTGSEVILSEANIPDMVRILENHGLVPVPARLDPRTLTVSAREVEALVTPRTRVILVGPLFGSHMPLAEIAHIARQHDLLLVEDNAQGYRGSNDRGSPLADVTFFSFGLIKTRTALGGAVVFARDPKLLQALERHVENYPRVSTLHFLRKLVRAALLHGMSQPGLFGLFWRFLEQRGANPDVWLSQAARGMSGPNFFTAIRHQPHRATLKLLHRRLHQTNSDDINARVSRGRKASNTLQNLLGQQGDDSVFWALAVMVPDREKLIRQARRAGFDLTFRSSSLISHSALPTPFSRALETVVFLPVGTPMPEREWQCLLQLVVQCSTDDSERPCEM